MSQSISFKTVANIQFASDSVLHLPDELSRLACKRPVIISDKGIVGLGLLDPVFEVLASNSIEYALYDETQADPPTQNVFDAVEQAKLFNADSVIGFGGGSSLDVAKLVACLAVAERDLDQMFGVDQVTGSRLPLIQVPTTAGTGSEATGVSIVTTGESTKAGIVSETLLADTILLDPKLTLGLPPMVTAATGIDAMVHAIEAFTSKRLKNSISDMLALKALSLMSRSIRTAVFDGANLAARSDMLLGAMFAGQAFANAPVGAVHALAYPLGGLFHIPHGLSNSLVLPHVLRFNGASADELYQQLGQVIDGASDRQLDGRSASESLSIYFSELAKDLGLETRLSDLGIPESALPELATQSMLQERLLINNPRSVSYEQALDIYRQAY